MGFQEGSPRFRLCELIHGKHRNWSRLNNGCSCLLSASLKQSYNSFSQIIIVIMFYGNVSHKGSVASHESIKKNPRAYTKSPQLRSLIHPLSLSAGQSARARECESTHAANPHYSHSHLIERTHYALVNHFRTIPIPGVSRHGWGC